MSAVMEATYSAAPPEECCARTQEGKAYYIQQPQLPTRLLALMVQCVFVVGGNGLIRSVRVDSGCSAEFLLDAGQRGEQLFAADVEDAAEAG